MTHVSGKNRWIIKSKLAEQIKKGYSLLTEDVLISKKAMYKKVTLFISLMNESALWLKLIMVNKIKGLVGY